MDDALEPGSHGDTAATNPDSWVDQYGDSLFAYALTRLRDSEAAEEVVQETFLAGLRARDQYSGKGPERAWLLGILKRKIIDYVRKRSKLALGLEAEDEVEASLFRSNGHWKRFQDAGELSPESALEKDEFWRGLAACLDSLPERQRAAFVLREMDGVSGEEVRSDLEISAANLWVLLHRARLRLAACMRNWAGSAT